jgi:hypothetical protein
MRGVIHSPPPTLHSTPPSSDNKSFKLAILMNLADPRIPRGYPAIFLFFITIQTGAGWNMNEDGSIPLDTLLLFIDVQIAREMNGTIKINTLLYYLSALKGVHDANGIVWTARDNPRVKFVLKRLLRAPGLPSQEGSQDHPVSLLELKSFCESLDINKLSDVVAGTLATCLFFGIGRTPELLHAKEHPPMLRTALRKKASPTGGDPTYSFCLCFPKVRTVTTQFISPLLSYGITSANFWISRLISLSKYTNLWQIDREGTIPDSRWLFDRFRPFISRDSLQNLGQSSFRAGGCTFLAASGHTLSNIQLLGRWETLKAFNRYLRDHPHILQLAFQNRL